MRSVRYPLLGHDLIEVISGNVFSTKVILGGYLHSSRTVTSKSQDELEAHKEETKKAAGILFASPSLNLGGNIAKDGSDETNKQGGVAQQSADLVWTARGGNTLLCSK